MKFAFGPYVNNLDLIYSTVDNFKEKSFQNYYYLDISFSSELREFLIKVFYSSSGGLVFYKLYKLC
jgi:hypothetical protein